MIAMIESKTQYGKMGKTGINLLSELDGDPVVSYAHSVQDALEWAKAFPLYENAIVDDLGDGRFIVSSQWQPRDKSFDLLAEWEGMENAEYTREQLFIKPVNTINENVSFLGYRK